MCLQFTESKAQQLSALRDSCYLYIEHQDTSAFNNTYKLISIAYEKEIDSEMYAVKKELCEMGEEDQSIRLLLIDSQKRYGTTDSHTTFIRKMMSGIDKKNSNRALSIINQYGWLGSDDIGDEANEALFLIIQHCSDTIIQTKCLPILEKAVSEGKAKGWHYAFLTDRALMNQGKHQIYGTQTIKIKNGRTLVVPIKDVHNIDKLRKKQGLEPLYKYMEYFGEEWSAKKYKKELPIIEEAFKSWLMKRKN
jgi:hypothetical protein